jgi:shikimate dehydrogenase
VIEDSVQRVGLIGWPVEHSVSPAMHNAAFAALGLPWRYSLLPAPPGQVGATLAMLRSPGFRGANVTLPHKQAVMPFLDSLAPDAEQLGAVNTLVVTRQADGMPVIGGFNTDAEGFVGALRHAGIEPERGGRVVVVGAGGAARAAVHGLLLSGFWEVVVLNRTVARLRTLASDFSRLQTWSDRIHALPLTPEALVESARAADLLVNATTVGMRPHGDASVWPAEVSMPTQLAVFDMVYNPLETRFLQQARESGALPIGGLEMLVQQGVLAFRMWTGVSPPMDLMRTAATGALTDLERQI